MHCFVGNLFRCKSAKNYKIRLSFIKLYQFNIKQMEMCSFLGHPVVLHVLTIMTIYGMADTSCSFVWLHCLRQAGSFFALCTQSPQGLNTSRGVVASWIDIIFSRCASPWKRLVCILLWPVSSFSQSLRYNVFSCTVLLLLWNGKIHHRFGDVINLL